MSSATSFGAKRSLKIAIPKTFLVIQVSTVLIMFPNSVVLCPLRCPKTVVHWRIISGMRFFYSDIHIVPVYNFQNVFVRYISPERDMWPYLWRFQESVFAVISYSSLGFMRLITFRYHTFFIWQIICKKKLLHPISRSCVTRN